MNGRFAGKVAANQLECNRFTSHVIPFSNSYDLGSSTVYWRNIYASGNANLGTVIASQLDVGGDIKVGGLVDGVDVAKLKADFDASGASGLDARVDALEVWKPVAGATSPFYNGGKNAVYDSTGGLWVCGLLSYGGMILPPSGPVGDESGVILRSGSGGPSAARNYPVKEFGLYSELEAEDMRFVTCSRDIKWYTDGSNDAGSVTSMKLSSSGDLDVKGNLTCGIVNGVDISTLVPDNYTGTIGILTLARVEQLKRETFMCRSRR